MARKTSDQAAATPAAIDPDAVYRVVLRRRGEIAPGRYLQPGEHEVLGSALKSLGDAVTSKERI